MALAIKDLIRALSLLKNEIEGKTGACGLAISGGSTLVAMMQTVNLGEGNNTACGGKLYATRPWAVLVEREMRSGVMMILKIARQDTAQVTLVENDNVIKAFTADRTDEALDVRILPG